MRFWDFQADARRSTRWLLLAFALCVAAVVAAVHLGLSLAWWLAVAWLPGHWAYPSGFLAANIGVALLLVLGGWWVETDQLRAGGRRLAQRVGAREARPGSSLAEQRLCNTVQEMCIAAHMPVPQVVVLARTGAINAFAAGWDPQDAILAVTQGALDHLSRDEIQGLVAHELSHLHEGDTRLNMRLAGMCYGLELLHGFGDSLRERGGLAWWFGTAVMAAGFVGWLGGRLLQAAVSRQREYLADARAVQWTRQREGLGGVLRKVMAQRQADRALPDPALHRGLQHPSLQHLLLVDVPARSRLAQALDSHPPLAERVRRLYGRSMPPLPLQAESLPVP